MPGRQGAAVEKTAGAQMSELEEMRAKLAAYEEADKVRKDKGTKLREAREKKRAADGKPPRATRQPREAAVPVVKTLEQIHQDQGEHLSGDLARLARRVSTREAAGQPREEALSAVLAQHAEAIRGTLAHADAHPDQSLEQATDAWTDANAPKTVKLYRAPKSKAPVNSEDESPASDSKESPEPASDESFDDELDDEEADDEDEDDESDNEDDEEEAD